jgi:hypothetical protein
MVWWQLFLMRCFINFKCSVAQTYLIGRGHNHVCHQPDYYAVFMPKSWFRPMGPVSRGRYLSPVAEIFFLVDEFVKFFDGLHALERAFVPQANLARPWKRATSNV